MAATVARRRGEKDTHSLFCDQPTVNLQKSHSVRASSVPSGVLGAARVENAGLLAPKDPL